MNESLTTLKLTLTAFFAALAAFLGWRVIMLLVWVMLMALDYLSGSLAARHNGTWTSAAARSGIWHKAGMVLVVLVSIVADFTILTLGANLPYEIIHFTWPVVIFPLTTMWYILTEIGSIIENAMEMGAAVPAWLPKLLNATLKAVDSAALKDE